MNDEGVPRPLILLLLLALSILIAAPLFVHPTYLGVQDWDQNLFKLAAPGITILEYGQFPLWNPWEGGGLPLLGHPESRFLSPTFVLPLAFGPVLGVKLEIVVHYFIGLWGTFALCKHYHLRDGAALAGTCIYMLSGMYSFAIASGMSVFMSGAFIPWCVLFFLRAEHRTSYARATGAALALMFLDGGVIFAVLTVLLLALYALFAAIFRRSRPAALMRTLVVTYAWSFAFAAIKLLPALELINKIPRHIDDYSGYSVMSLLDALVDRHHTLGAFLNHGTGFWSGASYEIDENGMYIGVLGVALVLVGLVALRRSALPLVAASFVFLWLAFGDRAPLGLWPALHELPVFSSMRVAQRFRFGGMLGAAVLAGSGAEWLARRLSLLLRARLPVASARRLGLLVLAVLAVDLVSVNSRPFADAFPIPVVARPPRGEFKQIRRLPRYDAQGNQPLQAAQTRNGAWSATYPAILANLGTLEMTGPMSRVIEPAALPATAEGYRGNAYCDTTPGHASIVMFSPNRIKVRVETAVAGVLIINQNYDDGWTSAAGRPTPTRGLLSLAVAAGGQSIEFVYLPRSFLLGAAMSICAMFIVAVRSARLAKNGSPAS